MAKERPPFGDLRTAPLLDAQVEVACAAGDLATAREAAGALAATAATYGTAGLRAAADLAEARVGLLAGDLDAAIGGRRRGDDPCAPGLSPGGEDPMGGKAPSG